MKTIDRPDISKLTTLGLGGRAAIMVQLENLEDYEHLPDNLNSLGGLQTILGNGSNLLVQDTDLPWTLINPVNGRKENPMVMGWEQGKILVRVGAGAMLTTLINWCADQGLGGLEGLVGVPGTVGGAIAGNAGAYGNQICSALHELIVFSPENGLQTFAEQDWEYGYRHFFLSGTGSWYVAAEAVLAFSKQDPIALWARLNENLSRKRESQPLNERTAGSIFKNPTGNTAGQLLCSAGFNGKRVGGMYFTEKHANFLANNGHGTYTQALELIDNAQQTILDKFGINLELEIKVWTCQQ